MNRFKKAAAAAGFAFWYDRSRKLWTLTKEGHETEYLSPELFRTTAESELIRVLITHPDKEGKLMELKEQPQFVNGVIMNRDHPETFEIPSDEEKAAIFPGDFVKVGFICGKDTERMWLEVTGTRDDGWIHGTLNNDPVIVNIACGEAFTVHRDHVLSIINGGTPA